MSGLVVSAVIWPVVAVAVGFGAGRLLRSTDRRDEQQRVAEATAPVELPRLADDDDDGRRSAAVGIGGS